MMRLSLSLALLLVPTYLSGQSAFRQTCGDAKLSQVLAVHAQLVARKGCGSIRGVPIVAGENTNAPVDNSRTSGKNTETGIRTWSGLVYAPYRTGFFITLLLLDVVGVYLLRCEGRGLRRCIACISEHAHRVRPS